jgi:hypothetical protein
MNFELIRNISTFTSKCKFVNTFARMSTFAKYFVAPLLVILQCTIEPALAEPVEMVAKLDRGFFVAKELCLEKADSVRVKNVDGVGAVEIRPKVSGVGAESKMPLQLERAKDSDKSNSQSDSPSWGYYLQVALLSLMSVVIPMIPVFINIKPNSDIGRMRPNTFVFLFKMHVFHLFFKHLLIIG